MKKILAALFILLLSSLIIIAHVLQINPFKPLEKGTVTVDSLTRQFSYYVPAGVSQHPKLIFVLHGSGGSPEGARVSTGHEFDKLADKNKDVIVVYPAGYNKYWNDCRKQAAYKATMLNIDDVAFLGKMIQYFKEKYNIDAAHVFAVGHSNGAQMCYKLAKEKPEWFKGLAAVSACLPTQENNDCFETHVPVSILVMNGTTDPINPYNGGEVIVGGGQKRGTVLSTDETIQYWVKNDNCASIPSTYNFPDLDATDNSTAISYLYKSNTTGKQVELIKIINGGHIIPNPGFTLWPKSLGNVNKDIDAPEIIWNFFNGL